MFFFIKNRTKHAPYNTIVLKQYNVEQFGFLNVKREQFAVQQWRIQQWRIPPPPLLGENIDFLCIFLNKVKLTPLFSAKMWLTPPPLAHSGSATVQSVSMLLRTNPNIVFSHCIHREHTPPPTSEAFGSMLF